MSKGTRNRAKRVAEAAHEPQPDVTGPQDATTAEYLAALKFIAVVTAADRLHLFAGDHDDEAQEAPPSVRRDPELLLEWCRRYQPNMVLGEESALIAACNRAGAKVNHLARAKYGSRPTNRQKIEVIEESFR